MSAELPATSEESEPYFRKLFVGGLQPDTIEETLKSHFEQWGEIIHCIVIRYRNSKKARGYGFITYKHEQMVDNAQAARPHKIDGREVTTRRVIRKMDSGKPEAQVMVKKLYVGGITDDLGEEDLREYFGSYGNIVSVNVVTDKDTGKKKGFAFVEFDDYDPVDKIVLKRPNFKDRRLQVNKALPREKMGNIKIKKEMEGFGRGGAAAASAARNGSYGVKYDNRGVWSDGYSTNYSIGGGGGESCTVRSGCYSERGSVQNTDYLQFSFKPYCGYVADCGWNNNYYSSVGRDWVPSFGFREYGRRLHHVRANTYYSQRGLRPFRGQGSGRYEQQ